MGFVAAIIAFTALFWSIVMGVVLAYLGILAALVLRRRSRTSADETVVRRS